MCIAPTRQTPKGRWVSRGPYFEAKPKDKSVKIADFTHRYEVPFPKIPTLAHLSGREYRELGNDRDQAQSSSGLRHDLASATLTGSRHPVGALGDRSLHSRSQCGS
jgi:hypothetical protein